jgi:hypothetical protein
MTVMTDVDMDAPAAPDPNMGLDVELEPVVESPEEEEEEEELPWGNDPATATWAPMMAEVNSTLCFQDTMLTWATIRSLAPIGDVPLLFSTSAIPNPQYHPPRKHCVLCGRKATSFLGKSFPTAQQQVPSLPPFPSRKQDFCT